MSGLPQPQSTATVAAGRVQLHSLGDGLNGYYHPLDYFSRTFRITSFHTTAISTIKPRNVVQEILPAASISPRKIIVVIIVIPIVNIIIIIIIIIIFIVITNALLRKITSAQRPRRYGKNIISFSVAQFTPFST